MKTVDSEVSAVRKPSILVVDADRLLRWSICAHLASRYRILAVATAVEAETLLASEQFEVVIVSSSVGGDTGLVELARARNPGARIIRFVTGTDSESRDPQLTYIEKPFTFEILHRALSLFSPKSGTV